MPQPIYEAQINVEALKEAIEEHGQDTVMDDLLAGLTKGLEYAQDLDGGTFELQGIIGTSDLEGDE